jgi:hypothetical protein
MSAAATCYVTEAIYEIKRVAGRHKTVSFNPPLRVPESKLSVIAPIVNRQFGPIVVVAADGSVSPVTEEN